VRQHWKKPGHDALAICIFSPSAVKPGEREFDNFFGSANTYRLSLSQEFDAPHFWHSVEGFYRL
jgi:hypothetical protein